MSLIIGSARQDERGKYRGGKAGDQTGREVSTQAYYRHSKGWYVLRAKNVSHANALASAMQQACNNNNIGYDQYNRGGVITQIKKYGALNKIAVKTECDCSSLVRACIIQACGKDVGNFTTSNEASVLEASGLFESKKAVDSSIVLYNGDILVTKTKGHTVIVVSGKARANTVNVPTNSSNDNWVNRLNAEIKRQGFSTYPLVKKGAKGNITRLIQERLNSVGFHLNVDGDFGTNTYNAVKVFQRNRGLKVDGKVGPKTWSWLIKGTKM